jgi:VWFA-related protein
MGEARTFLLLATAAASLAAQDRQFNVLSRLVQVPVVVTDSKGRSVDGLETADFVVLDNGKAREVVVDTLSTGLPPIALVIAIQSSGISAAVVAKVRKIEPIIQPMITGELGCAALISFDDRVRWLQDCTNDSYHLNRAFHALQPGVAKGGRMLDAAQEAINMLGKRTNCRRILLLISESKDRHSETHLEKVARAAEGAAVSIYAVTYSAFTTAFTSKSPPATEPPRGQRKSTIGQQDPTRPPAYEYDPTVRPAEQSVDILGGLEELGRLGKENTTAILASRTGGTTLSFTRLKGLEQALQKVGAELHTQYVLSFTPDAKGPGFHRLEVRVKNRPDILVRARQGYWVSEPP